MPSIARSTPRFGAEDLAFLLQELMPGSRGFFPRFRNLGKLHYMPLQFADHGSLVLCAHVVPVPARLRYLYLVVPPSSYFIL
jgi:hypothetical protein